MVYDHEIPKRIERIVSPLDRLMQRDWIPEQTILCRLDVVESFLY
jgi:hypothetical protein